jgi:hypothetical protein
MMDELKPWEQQPGEAHADWYERTHDTNAPYVILYLAAVLLLGCLAGGLIAFVIIR